MILVYSEVWSLSLYSIGPDKAASDEFGQPNRFRSCADSSYCTPIRKCSSFRDGWKRRGVGITCGHGSGLHRRVCCPRIHSEEVPARQTNRLIASRPTTPTDSSSEADCGVSQGVDWFQEHMTDYEDELEATWPWMVAVKIRNSSDIPYYRCSGLLLDETHVLTTAHCFSSVGDDVRYTVHVGSDDYNLAKEYPVTKIKVHEGYKEDSPYDDIAILTLSSEVNFPNFVPICLPDDRIEGKDLTGWGTTLVGWGNEDLSEAEISVLKQLDDIPIVSNQECNQIYEERIPPFRKQFPRGITKEIMCTGKTQGSRDVCWGTSGAPLMVLDRKRWFVVGLSSFDNTLCRDYFLPSGYTNVSTYVDWIKQNIKN